MTKLELATDYNGTGTTEPVIITGGYAEISVFGDSFDSVTFEDSKHDLGFADVLDAETGSAISITSNTHELNLAPSLITARQIRATITNGTNVNIIITQAR